MTKKNTSDRIYNCHMNKEVLKMFYSEQQVVEACTGEPSLIFNVIRNGDFEVIERLLEENKADLIGVGRAIYKDSNWAKQNMA